MDYTKEFYDINGNVVSEDGPQVVAKKLTNIETGNIRYFAKFVGGLLFDPHGPYVNTLSQLRRAEFKKISFASFELYTQFLRGKAQGKLRQAQRAI